MAYSEPETVTKTYAVHAVTDVRSMKRLSFGEAVACGLIDPNTGAYRNNSTGESIYVGDAIRKGFIKATVVNDPRSLDISPDNKFNIANTGDNAALRRFQQPGLAALGVGAFTSTRSTSYSNGGGRGGYGHYGRP